MLHYVAVFVILVVVAAMIGFTDLNGEAIEIAKVLFIVFHLLFGVALLLMRSRITSDTRDTPQK